MNNLINDIKNKCGNSSDIVIRSIDTYSSTVTIIFNEVLCSGDDINDFLLKKITKLINVPTKDTYSLIINSIPLSNVKELDDVNSVIDYIFKGFCIVLVDKNFIAVEVKARLDRGINTTDSEVSIIGPKDAFNENFNTNVGLIRRRIRSNNLYLKTLFIGKNSNTKVGV